MFYIFFTNSTSSAKSVFPFFLLFLGGGSALALGFGGANLVVGWFLQIRHWQAMPSQV
jgi:hypothetical protein